MTPREFLQSIVRSNVDEFHRHYGDLRRAHNAIGSVDALAAHIYAWCAVNAPAEVAGLKDDSGHRAALAGSSPSFGLLRDIAKAQKHVRLTRHKPRVTGADQVSVRPIGFGERKFGAGRFGGPPQVIVELSPDDFEFVEEIVDDALSFLESEMIRLGL